MPDTCIDGKVQRIQAMLYAKAKQEPAVRFEQLYKYVTRREWIDAATERVLSNRGSRTAGMDGKTRAQYLEQKARTELTTSIQDELTSQTYKPQPVRRVYIPKANGQKRPLGIATIKDRIVQQLFKMLLEPVYEATFLPCSYGFRPHRCTWDALAEAHYYLRPGRNYSIVIEGDIQNCFGSIQHGLLMQQLQRRIRDDRVWAGIWQMLKAGVIEALQYFETTEGAPQGSPLSPLLANVALGPLDEWFNDRYHTLPSSQRQRRKKHGQLAHVRYIRYADDFIVLTKSSEQEAAALKPELAEFIRQELRMTLSEEKTLITDVRNGFDFLGVRTLVAPQKSNPDKCLPYQTPALKSVNAYRRKVKELTSPKLDCIPPAERMRSLNWLIQGWANYHRWGNAKQTFSALSLWTGQKVCRMLGRYKAQNRTDTYREIMRPVSECSNLGKWQKYTHWLTPSVPAGGETRIGLLPMGIISTAFYWYYRGAKIPLAFALRDDDTAASKGRDTEFDTDVEIIERTARGRALRGQFGTYDAVYFHNRKAAFRRDHYTCTLCQYKSKRGKGDVHDLEAHHIDPNGGNEVDNLQTVCLKCHRQLTAM